MGKKLFSTERWKRYLKARQAAEEAKHRKRGESRRSAVPTPRKKRRFANLATPSVFSLTKNPEEVIGFLRSLPVYARTHHLSLDLSGITEISTDAIAAFAATIQSIKNTLIRGNQPDHPACNEVLLHSGFFSHVRSMSPLPPGKHGRISQKQSKQVEPHVARDLVHFGMLAITGKDSRCCPAYSILIEAMNNTHNHAAGKRTSKETWWATVYADVKRRRVCYTFLDTGVGIFRSVRIGGFRKAYRALGVINDSDILRDILEGRVQSSTGIPHRGKGLPFINRLAKGQRVKSLVIIANDVYANVSEDRFSMLDHEFPGTLLYWETEEAIPK